MKVAAFILFLRSAMLARLNYCVATVPHLQDKSADFSSSSSVGQKNRAVAWLVAGSYEVHV